jgi:hypothetical protein
MTYAFVRLQHDLEVLAKRVHGQARMQVVHPSDMTQLHRLVVKYLRALAGDAHAGSRQDQHPTQNRVAPIGHGRFSLTLL